MTGFVRGAGWLGKARARTGPAGAGADANPTDADANPTDADAYPTDADANPTDADANPTDADANPDGRGSHRSSCIYAGGSGRGRVVAADVGQQRRVLAVDELGGLELAWRQFHLTGGGQLVGGYAEVAEAAGTDQYA